MKLKTEDIDVDIDMSPMIDMVFLLLIFFIVASAMVELAKPAVSLPSAKAAKVPKEITGRLMVSIDRDRQIWIDMNKVNIEEMKTRVKDELEKDAELRVFIRADEDVPYGVCKEVMLACKEVEAVNLIYATFEK